MTEGGCNLDAFRVRDLCLGARAGLQGFVEMVDDLARGIFHRQHTVIGHPAAVEGVALRVCWKT